MIAPERQHSINNVPGRMMPCHVWPGSPHLFSSQTWISEKRLIKGYGTNGRIQVKAEFNDNPRNGHNTFSITATVITAESLRQKDVAGSGRLHDEIAATFPELAHLIPWHLVSTNGPMHYLANTLYLASNRDHRGKAKGEPYAFQTAITFGDNPIQHHLPAKFLAFLQDAKPHNGRDAFDFEILGLDHKERETYGTRYTFGGHGDGWHTAPFKSEQEATDFLFALQNCSPQFVAKATAWSDGKERELEAARSAAVWPDATDEQLTAEPEALKAALVARLPGLLARFRADVEAAGFLWGAE
jgi:hypothetical protein